MNGNRLKRSGISPKHRTGVPTWKIKEEIERLKKQTQ